MMDVWVQGRLFDRVTDAATRGVRRVPREESTRSVRVGWSPVTRDPAVAASHANGALLSSDIRTGLANALDRLSPELRQSIRAAVSPRRASAA